MRVGSTRATWSGALRDSSRLAPIISRAFASVWKLIKTRHMRLQPSNTRNAIDRTTESRLRWQVV